MLAAESPHTPVIPQAQNAAYIRLVTWFLDDPSASSPFSVHRFAAEGKKLGKEVGEWFGPSTAGGAIKTLVGAFAPANLGVVLAMDTTVYQSQVFEAAGIAWSRPVLILLPVRLGLNGVNPIYFASIKQYFTLPQCAGIAGGRPSSSYYFVGCQGDSLFYIDPHHTKPSVKAVSVPDELRAEAASLPLSRESPGPSDIDTSAIDDFFTSSYSLRELDSFHCEKVRKMHISGLDPSMLLGILCQTREEWQDLCRRMDELKSTCTPIIHIVPEMPAWMRASSRSVSAAAMPTAEKKQETQVSQPDTPFRVGDGAAQSSVDDSYEFADSDDWDIDESDGDSLLAASADRHSACFPHQANGGVQEGIASNEPEEKPSSPQSWVGLDSSDAPRARQISDTSEQSGVTAKQAVQ